MKYLLVIGDGIADRPVAALDGRTPLEAAEMPYLRELSRRAAIGKVLTVPEGLPPGSDTAILSIFGYDPRRYYSGRSPLEAVGCGITLAPGNVSFRLNLVTLEGEGDMEGRRIVSHNGSRISGEEGERLVRDMLEDAGVRETLSALGMKVSPLPSFRHIGVMERAEGTFGFTPPHDIPGEAIAYHLPGGSYGQAMRALMRASFAFLSSHPLNAERAAKGLGAANCLWPWGEGEAVALPNFIEKYGHGGAVITAVPLVKGIAGLAGLSAPEVEGATGELDTNYQGKVEEALRALEEDDFACVHIEAPDEMSHNGSLPDKMQALRDLDAKVLRPLCEGMKKWGGYRLLFLSDHATPVELRIHTGEPVPFLLYDATCDLGGGLFTEKGAEEGELVAEGSQLMGKLFEE